MKTEIRKILKYKTETLKPCLIMNKKRIIDIHNYCIGGCVPFKTMEKEVLQFLKEVDDITDKELNELKNYERTELELIGYYDY